MDEMEVPDGYVDVPDGFVDAERLRERLLRSIMKMVRGMRREGRFVVCQNMQCRSMQFDEDFAGYLEYRLRIRISRIIDDAINGDEDTTETEITTSDDYESAGMDDNDGDYDYDVQIESAGMDDNDGGAGGVTVDLTDDGSNEV